MFTLNNVNPNAGEFPKGQESVSCPPVCTQQDEPKGSAVEASERHLPTSVTAQGSVSMSLGARERGAKPRCPHTVLDPQERLC